MFQNYLKFAWRNIKKGKSHSAINITGLSIGIAVAMIIGLWVWDELSFNKNFSNYNRLGQIYQNRTFNGKVGTYAITPQPMSSELRTNYPEIKDAALSTTNDEHVLTFGEKMLTTKGMFVEPSFANMFSLDMRVGTRAGLEDMRSTFLSASLAKSLFGKEDPIGKTIKVDNSGSLIVKGIFEDFPGNSEFNGAQLLMPWAFLVSEVEFIRTTQTNWDVNNYACYIQLTEHADWQAMQSKIRNMLEAKVSDGQKPSKPEVLLLPMSRWRLYSDFVDGKNAGGFITLVRMFAIIGVLVLLLACINFMNLSTARSVKRAREVGIRKTIGSYSSQLVKQFLTESVVMNAFAFLIALAMVFFALPWFSSIVAREIRIPFSSPVFWLVGLLLILVSGLIAGSYPAFFLSSFQPIKVLKGTFSTGKFASLSRKALVVIQFTVSVALIIGTVVIYKQIQHAKDRQLGYNVNRLLYVPANTPDLQKLDYNVLKNDLTATGVVENMAKSSTPLTVEGNLNTGFKWSGSPEQSDILFTVMNVTETYGKTVGFEVVEGRDFSEEFTSDSTAMIINQTSANIMGNKDIIGKTITGNGNRQYTIIGVVKDIIRTSPYSKPIPAIFVLAQQPQPIVNVRLKPSVALSTALAKLEDVFKKHNPGSPFNYAFADAEVEKKFLGEKLISKLAIIFAVLAIFISCLGIFGLASFVAEQRTKEIGVRKVLGASVSQVWILLVKDFILLVAISCLISSPIAFYVLNNWLEDYEYRITIGWSIFVVSALLAIAVTLFTVSFQSIKAAVANPIRSLRSE
jgi:putative ABC transport system permease protein